MKHADTSHGKSEAKKEPGPSSHPADEQDGTPHIPGAAPAQPETTMGQEELDALRDKATKADEHWERLLRTAADLDNYKKRAAREKEEALRRERERLVLKVLPLMDALETGLAAWQDQAASPSMLEGLGLVRNMFANFLKECGVDEIAAVGRPFDPVLHHAVSQEPSEQVAPDAVIRQHRKGYRMGDRVLRAADVVVSSGRPGHHS